MTINFKVEIWRKKKYVTAREDGKVLSRKHWSPTTFTKTFAMAQYKATGSFSPNTIIKRTRLENVDEISKLSVRKPNFKPDQDVKISDIRVNKPSFFPISKSDKKLYQYSIILFMRDGTQVSARSQRIGHVESRFASNKSEAYEVAWENVLRQLTAIYLGETDLDEAGEIFKKHVKEVQEGWVIYRARTN